MWVHVQFSIDSSVQFLCELSFLFVPDFTWFGERDSGCVWMAGSAHQFRRRPGEIKFKHLLGGGRAVCQAGRIPEARDCEGAPGARIEVKELRMLSQLARQF